MSKKSDHTLDEHIFREAMDDVRPIKQRKREPEQNPLKPRLFEQPVETDTNTDSFSDEIEITDIKPDQILSFCKPGVRHTEFKKLRSGRLHIIDELDLHGMKLRHARQLLNNFLVQIPAIPNSCIIIIHGRGLHNADGKSILKSHVNSWLKQHQRVLAFHSTLQRDGGRGAVYVLLKQ